MRSQLVLIVSVLALGLSSFAEEAVVSGGVKEEKVQVKKDREQVRAARRKLKEAKTNKRPFRFQSKVSPAGP